MNSENERRISSRPFSWEASGSRTSMAMIFQSVSPVKQLISESMMALYQNETFVDKSQAAKNLDLDHVPGLRNLHPRDEVTRKS